MSSRPYFDPDGKLLVADLDADHAQVSLLLKGEWRPRFWAEQFWPSHLFKKYPALRTEYLNRHGEKGWPTTR